MLLTTAHRVHESSDPFFRSVLIVCWTQAELTYSLATATLPCLMPIMSKFDTNLGALDHQTVAASDFGRYALSQSKSRMRSMIKRNIHHAPLESEVQLRQSFA